MERTSVVDQCGKLFKNRTVLTTHMRIHRDIKPFKCQCCWKTFSQKVTLDSHIQTHTGQYNAELGQAEVLREVKVRFLVCIEKNNEAF